MKVIKIKTIVFLVLVSIVFSLILILRFQGNNEESTWKPLFIELDAFIEKELEPYQIDDGTIQFKQLKEHVNIANSFESHLDSSINKRFVVGYDTDDIPTFPLEENEMLYNELLEVTDEKDIKLLKLLYNLPEHYYKSISLNYNNLNQKSNVLYTSQRIYSNSSLNVIVIDNLESIVNTEAHDFLEMLESSEFDSIINDTPISCSFTYNQRLFQPQNTIEEQYHYFAYFKQDDKSYLIHFISNYTLENERKSAVGAPVQTQEHLRVLFCKIVDGVVELITT